VSAPDPYGRPVPSRPLTADELLVITSGAGYRRWSRGGSGSLYDLPSGEANQALYAWKWRGLWPNPGIANDMERRNPIIASGVTKVEYYTSSLDWRIVDPEAATADETRQAEYIRASVDELPGGFGAFIRRALSSVQYGFSLFEKVWKLVDGTYSLRDLVWIAPWTVQGWVLDAGGDMVGILQLSERGRVFIPRAKLVHFARRFMGRNWEGESALRSLWAYDEAKRQEILSDRITRERWGEGTLVFTEPESPDADDRSRIDAIGVAWQSGEQSYIRLPFGWAYKFEHGGSQAPDPAPRLQYYDHQASRMLDDTLSELGFSAFGARAVGSEMRLASQRQLTGVCSSLCADIEQQVISDFFLLNGWTSRRPTVTVSGFEDDARLQRVADFAQKNLLGEISERDVIDFRRALGVRVDRVALASNNGQAMTPAPEPEATPTTS